ncbi:helicase C-terminal domain-containing protein [Proteinivorax tanatarense]|uniref:DNA 5'-3' helicase n=1 Tax=Proteinivorax tanatarense TaxID=1260629 RepID=A0AAU7VLD2_9FIRM
MGNGRKLVENGVEQMEGIAFKESSKKAIEAAILAAKGNEVFFKGFISDGNVIDVEVLARGNQFSVPAILQDLEPGDVVIHNHPSGRLTPSTADINIASRLGADGIGFIIVNNDCRSSYTVVEPKKPDALLNIEVGEVRDVLDESGAISKLLPLYEKRDEQLVMAEKVIQGYNEGKNVIVEAGTGTGKSLAYLIPSILWAVKNKKRVVVSTNTINLQEQIISKDIPFLQQTLAVNFKGVLVKGRSNYLCKAKLDKLQGDLFEETDEELMELKKIREWAFTTSDGSKADLGFRPLEKHWEKLSSEGDLCTKAHCPHFRDCFFFTARRESATADIMVVNHHLLFADLALKGKGLEGGVLPNYHGIVLDEAHNVEDVATTYFGASINRFLVLKQLRRIYQTKIKGKQTGTLQEILVKAQTQRRLPVAAKKSIENHINNIIPLLAQLVDGTNEFFTAIEKWIADDNKSKLRITNQVTKGHRFQTIKELSKKYVNKANTFTSEINSLLDALEELPSDVFSHLLTSAVELNAMNKRIEGIVSTIESILNSQSDQEVRWIEIKASSRGKNASLCLAPLDVSFELNDNVFQKYETVILTSATIATNGNFSYIKKRIGLSKSKGNLIECILPSPFDYKRQVLLCVPMDIPLPSSSEFLDENTKFILKAILKTEGRAFVLFTSFKMLNDVFYKLKSHLENCGIKPLKQGQHQRHYLLETFKNDVNSVLFATASFWEGVDVQGKSLSNVILVKLPFSVPDEPIIQARQELIEKEGGNPFMNYTVPQAILRFKQGFGRLIRSKEDKGVVVCTDKRILTKYYGKMFLKSLPSCSIKSGNSSDILNNITYFMK